MPNLVEWAGQYTLSPDDLDALGAGLLSVASEPDSVVIEQCFWEA
jgi:hypothetical protein